MRHKLDKETAALADELGGLPVLTGLDSKAVAALASTGRVVHLPAEWALVTESQPADCCYVLLAGEAEVRQHGQAVATLGAGALAGEAALVDHRTRNATVVTTQQVRALRLGFDDLTALFAQHPAIESAFRGEWGKRSAGV